MGAGLKVWSLGDPELRDGELWMIQLYLQVYLCPQVSEAADLLSATFQSADASMRHAELNLQNDDAIVLLAPSLTDPGSVPFGACLCGAQSPEIQTFLCFSPSFV